MFDKICWCQKNNGGTKMGRELCWAADLAVSNFNILLAGFILLRESASSGVAVLATAFAVWALFHSCSFPEAKIECTNQVPPSKAITGKHLLLCRKSKIIQSHAPDYRQTALDVEDSYLRQWKSWSMSNRKRGLEANEIQYSITKHK